MVLLKITGTNVSLMSLIHLPQRTSFRYFMKIVMFQAVLFTFSFFLILTPAVNSGHQRYSCDLFFMILDKYAKFCVTQKEA
jgi:hypothetical protein